METTVAATETGDSNSGNQIELQTLAHDSNILSPGSIENIGGVTSKSSHHSSRDAIKLEKEGNEDQDLNDINEPLIDKSANEVTIHKG